MTQNVKLYSRRCPVFVLQYRLRKRFFLFQPGCSIHTFCSHLSIWSSFFYMRKRKQFAGFCLPFYTLRFPNNYKLISKMIQSFMSNAISKKDYSKMASTFAKGHKRYKLTSGHFEGFKEALLDTIKLRSGNLATIELVTAWKITIGAIVGALHKAYYSVLSRRRRWKNPRGAEKVKKNHTRESRKCWFESPVSCRGEGQMIGYEG